MNSRILRVALEKDADILIARQRARQLAGLCGLDSAAQTRLATAVSEIARNAIEHGGGGLAEYLLVGSVAPQLLEVRITDNGPGIADPAAARAGQTKSPGGLGIGLSGAERLVDRFSLQSKPGQGTAVTLSKLLPDRTALIDKTKLAAIVDDLGRSTPEGTIEELKRQNRELLLSLDEIQRQRERLAMINGELEDTNRGVVALYAELDERAEHLKRADEIKTRFLSNMSHEFRTPLNSILALCKFLEARSDGPLTLEQERQVGFVRKSAESLSELVEDLLDIAKVAAGKTVIRPVEYELGNLFGALRGMLRPLLVNNQVELVFEDVVGLPTVFGDESKVSQIVRNFISNALKFTEKGTVRISAVLDEANASFTIAVADTGIGIPAEHHEHIFEEFAQVDSPIQRRVKGTGLGLPLSKRLAELMGGKVALVSSPGQGSTFSVTLPMVFQEGTDSRTPPTIIIDPDRTPVLAVENNAADAAVLETILRKSRYQLLVASNLAQARRIIVTAQPQALLLDIMLADEQSWKLLAEMKRTPEMASIPVIIISSANDPSKAAALGADAWTAKPVERQWLIQKLDKLVRDFRVKRVLVIDDDNISRYVIRQYLSRCGAEVVEADSGAGGLRAAIEHRPDLVLLDINMPDRDGFSVLDDISSDERTADLEVVIVTSQVLSDTDRGRLAHARSIVPKNQLSVSALSKLLDPRSSEERMA